MGKFLPRAEPGGSGQERRECGAQGGPPGGLGPSEAREGAGVEQRRSEARNRGGVNWAGVGTRTPRSEGKKHLSQMPAVAGSQLVPGC